METFHSDFIPMNVIYAYLKERERKNPRISIQKILRISIRNPKNTLPKAATKNIYFYSLSTHFSRDSERNKHPTSMEASPFQKHPPNGQRRADSKNAWIRFRKKGFIFRFSSFISFFSRGAWDEKDVECAGITLSQLWEWFFYVFMFLSPLTS